MMGRKINRKKEKDRFTKASSLKNKTRTFRNEICYH
jgi:hypothetical protein